jgi:hypothetical protein
MKKYIRTDLVANPLSKQTLETYTNTTEFACTYLSHSLLKKWSKGGCEKTRIQAATDLWYEAERSCALTNHRLDSLRDLDVIRRIQKKIRNLIGPAPDLAHISKLCRWGPGATFDLKRVDATVHTKIARDLTVTEPCVKYLELIFERTWYEAQRTIYPRYEVVRGNRCVTVPKDSTKHRMIACEPTANGFIQSGVGRYIRRQMRQVGIDLDDQTPNQNGAKVAQSEGLATIDLSMASDTMSRSIVDLLLPPKWTAFLEDLRSPYSFLKGKWVRLEKFSSMGNGFTFELETLIFWAICSEVAGRNVLVYGDDIITDQSAFAETVQALKFFGFATNEEKSYGSGPFYESCGSHYYNGSLVTPVYQKKTVDNAAELIRFHNRLFRWGSRNNCLHLVMDALLYLRSLPMAKRIVCVPALMQDDCGFLDSKTIFREGRKFLALVAIASKRRCTEPEQLSLYSYYLRDPVLYSNADPDGSASFVQRTAYAFRKRKFWSSSLELKRELHIV